MSDSDPGLSQPLGAYGPRTADRSPEIEVIPIGAEDLPSAPVDKTRPVADGLPSANQSSNRPCQCSTPATGRNLVVCIDGTANQFGKKNSHVVELYSRLIKDENQLTYYNSGIGTYVKESKWYPSYWKQGFTNKVDLAIAWNFKKIVLSAYQWLSENYKPGDKIYLFGFSRGAYQIRVIAGMIMTVGLLHKGNNEQIEFAYELYIATTAGQGRKVDIAKPGAKKEDENVASESGQQDSPQVADKSSPLPKPFLWFKRSPKHVEEALELSERFKKALSQRNVNVHFVGAWDTVSSIGFARGPGLPETTTGMTHVCIFRHALALDELRVKFLPEYANGGHGPRTEPESNRQDTPSTSAGLDRSAEKGRSDPSARDKRQGDVKEVWFAGSHSDIGGGNDENTKLDRFGPALQWMTYEALLSGVRMEPFIGKWQNFSPHHSMNWFWRLLEGMPLRRLSYDPTKDNEHTRRWPPHLCAARQVMHGQMIHESVFSQLDKWTDNKPYRPMAILPKGWEWEPSSLKKRKPSALESDIFQSAVSLVNTLKMGNLSEAQRNVLFTLASSENGRQSIIDTPNAASDLFGALRTSRPEGETYLKEERQRIADVILALSAFRSLPPDATQYTAPEISRLLAGADTGNPQILRAVAMINRVFCNYLRLPPLQGHDSSVSSVAVSADGSRIASGSWDKTIRIWNAVTGEAMVGPLMGHTDVVFSVAFSPHGKLLASGSRDRSIRLWDSETGQQEGQPLLGHSDSVWSVAFSPNGERIVSGCQDGILKIWDMNTRQSIGECTVDSGVNSVAFSLDSKHIVSDR